MQSTCVVSFSAPTCAQAQHTYTQLHISLHIVPCFASFSHNQKAENHSNDGRTMTLVDLPGIAKVPVGDQPSEIEARI